MRRWQFSSDICEKGGDLSVRMREKRSRSVCVSLGAEGRKDGWMEAKGGRSHARPAAVRQILGAEASRYQQKKSLLFSAEFAISSSSSSDIVLSLHSKISTDVGLFLSLSSRGPPSAVSPLFPPLFLSKRESYHQQKCSVYNAAASPDAPEKTLSSTLSPGLGANIWQIWNG